MSADIGARVGSLIPAGQQGRVADAVGMPADAMSRAVRGQRSFSAVELVRIAEHLGAEVHWLITGEPDPHRVTVVARHDYDPSTGIRTIPGHSDDRDVLNDIALAYRQAATMSLPKCKPPTDVADARAQLGPDFVRTLLEDVEKTFGINMIRVAELSTAYGFTVGDNAIIAIPASGSWFRENWDIAHELGHFAYGHTDAGLSEETRNLHEWAANGFAAELLMPAERVHAQDWASMTAGELAALVWDFGVSTAAVGHRLDSLQIPASPVVEEWRTKPTQRLLRRHWRPALPGDPITARMDAAALRRFPPAIQDAHLELIAQGQLRKATLAWMLGVSADALEVDQPAAPGSISSSELMTALGI